MNDLDKATYRRMRRAFGNGNEAKGRAIMQVLALRLEHARREHPVFADGVVHALAAINGEMSELVHAVYYEAPGRERDEALDVIATAVRFLGEEYK